MPKYRNGSRGNSKADSLDCESGSLVLNYSAHLCVRLLIKPTARFVTYHPRDGQWCREISVAAWLATSIGETIAHAEENTMSLRYICTRVQREYNVLHDNSRRTHRSTH